MGWRESILKEFVSDVSRLTLVADPDGLLTEEVLVNRLRESGFEIIEYEDAISFRYAYETKYRSQWDKGITTDLVVVLRTEESDLARLPYDLYTKGRKLSFSINKIFPYLSSPVVEKLDKTYFEKLSYAHQDLSERIGDNKTKDFILENVFEINPELIKTTPKLLNLLLKIHYSGLKIPETLQQRIINRLNRHNIFCNWPLEVIFSDKNSFYEFLQERWPVFLDSYNPEKEDNTEFISYENEPYNLRYPGPARLPFDNNEVRIYIDDLFAEGKLKPVSCRNSKLKNSWAGFGIKDDTQEEFNSRIDKRISGLIIPKDECRHSDWLSFASDYSSLKSFVFNRNNDGFAVPSELKDKFLELSAKANETFSGWLQKHYNGLISLPPIPPVMVHQILRYLQRKYEDNPDRKTALIVIDGLSLAQWFTIKNVLLGQNPELKFDESSIFAWVPTLTTVSRQAIFSGKIPLYFSDHINTTSAESKSWTNYWENAGVLRQQIKYEKNLNDEDIIHYLKSEFNPDNTKVAGFVINIIDNIMHGMQLGETGMHNQTEQWSKMGYLNEMISYLLENDFDVYITSDHGNIESIGIGNPSEGSISEVKGERVRIYSDELLLSRVSEKFPSGIKWKPPGLPKDYYPFFAPDNSSFTKSGNKSVSHGGISIEETIVPFITVSGKVNK
jgi:hypothetical protein